MGDDASVDHDRKVALVIHPSRMAAKELAGPARAWWEARGYEVVEADAGADELERLPSGEFAFAISLGGDGTMLRTVQLAIDAGIPVLGVNLGNLGYLTQVEPSGMIGAFERLVDGDFEVEERMTLLVRVEGPERSPEHFVALNEAAVEKPSPGHTVRLAVSIDGRPFLTYAADGLLVSTPTGSTAYNLSLRGPIVSPKLRALILTPISPHMLFDRSLVLEPTEPVRLDLLEGWPAVLVVDGSITRPLEARDAVVLGAGPSSARIVAFGSRDFHAILRAKFNLADR